MYFEPFINRPVKSLLSAVLLFLGLYTLFFYQKLQVESVEKFLEITTNPSFNVPDLWITWGLNLACTVSYVLLGWAWIKEIFSHNYHYEDQTYSVIICLIMGLVFILSSWFFISFIFTNLIGVVIVTALVFAAIYGSSNNRRR